MSRVGMTFAVAAILVGIVTSFPGAARVAGAEPTAQRVLLINQVNAAFPAGSRTAGQQILMLLRHFAPATELVTDDDYRPGSMQAFDRIVVLGNDATEPPAAAVVVDARARTRPTMWVGYGLGHAFTDPDRDIGFSPGFVNTASAPVAVTYRGQRYPSRIQDYFGIRIADPDVDVLATIEGAGEPVPLAVRSRHFWFFGGFPGFNTDYPDPAVDAPNLIFADLLHDFFETVEHDVRQAIIRLEDVSTHIPPSRIIEAVDTLAERRVPFVIGVIPAQRLTDGSVLSLHDRPDFVQALRYAEEHGGTIALHGYHHTFGQGEDYEFWDALRRAPLDGERWETYSLKVEDGIRSLRDEGLEPRLWETPHYAASDLAYKVFAHYFSHAIENRDPVTWLPYPSGPDPYGQILIPENIGYINENTGWTVEAQLKRAALLRIVRDATAVGFYHPANIPASDLARLVDGLSAEGYQFGDVRNLPLKVDFSYARDPAQTAAAAARTEPGLTVIALERAATRLFPVVGAIGDAFTTFAAAIAAVGVFLLRLRAQWQPNRAAQRSRVEEARIARRGRVAIALVATSVLALATVGLIRQALLPTLPTIPVARVVTAPVPKPERPAIASDGWEVSTYFTAVEKFYSGRVIELRGCPVIDCANGTTLLGRFPAEFLAAVKEEGSGKLTKAIGGSSYVNWSANVGYWLDSAARDARGSILQPYVSAAADPAIDYVTTFRLENCGRDVRSRNAIDASVCDAIRQARWIVRDRFTVGAVGKHVDLYIGEQDQTDFVVRSPRALHLERATIELRPYGQGQCAIC